MWLTKKKPKTPVAESVNPAFAALEAARHASAGTSPEAASTAPTTPTGKDVRNPLLLRSRVLRRSSSIPAFIEREKPSPRPEGAGSRDIKSEPPLPEQVLPLVKLKHGVPTGKIAGSPLFTLRIGERFSGYLERLECRKRKGPWEFTRRWCVVTGCVLCIFADDSEEVLVDVVLLGPDSVGHRISYAIVHPDITAVLGRRMCWALGSVPKQALTSGDFDGLPHDDASAPQVYEPGKQRFMYFQAADNHDRREWLDVVQAQAKLSRDAPATSLWSIDPPILEKLTAMTNAPFSVGDVTPHGPEAEPLAEYTVLGEVGHGSFGSVLGATHNATKVSVAIKSLEKPPADNAKLQKVLRGEIACMERLRGFGPHANLVTLIDVHEDDTVVYLVMELATGKELQAHIDAVNATETASPATAAAAGDSSLPPAPRRRRRKGNTRMPGAVVKTPSRQGLEEDKARRIVRDVAAGILHMHRCGVIHRDLKPENVQMLPGGDAKVLDYGFGKLVPLDVILPIATGMLTDTAGEEERFKQEIAAIAARTGHSMGPGAGAGSDESPSTAIPMERTEEDPYWAEVDPTGEIIMSTMFGTKYAAAPEIWQRTPYNRKVDSWGIGVIMFVCLFGIPPFSEFGGAAEHQQRIIHANYQKPEPAWSSISEKAKDLLSKLLVSDPEERVAVDDILQHPWFKSCTPQVAYDVMMKRSRRLSGLRRHALMRGVAPPAPPKKP